MPIQRPLAARLLAAAVLSVVCPSVLAAQPYLVENINRTAGEAISSTPGFLGELDELSVFLALDPEFGQEPWVSDGTAAGTRLLGDLFPGPGYSLAQRLWQSRGLLYFTSNSLEGGGRWYDLWRTDGTPAGTVRLTYGVNVFPGGALGEVEDRGLVLFTAWSFEHDDYEPWVTDGTPGGTRLVDDLGSPFGSAPAGPKAKMHDRLLFVANDAEDVRRLWRTDGTAAGTSVVGDVAVLPSGSTWLTAIGDRALLLADDGVHGVEPWVSDGTAAGTRMVLDLTPGAPGTSILSPIAVDAGRAFFFAVDGPGRSALWRTDGTAVGTARLASFPGESPFLPFFGANLTSFDGTLFFTVDDGVHGVEVWRSDGTPAGTRLVRDVCPGPCSFGSSFLYPTALGIVFLGDDGVAGEEPWITDGTAAGTRRIADLCAGSCSGTGFPIGELPGRLILGGYVPDGSQQLWATDGTTAGTVGLTDFTVPCALCQYRGSGVADGVLLFGADDGVHGTELWRTDGTPGGTHLLRDIAFQGDGSSSPNGLTRVGDRVFFDAFDGVHGRELWRTDGTSAGTALVADLVPDNAEASWSTFEQLTPVGDDLAFLIDRSDLGTSQVWRTDGDAARTVRLLEVFEPIRLLVPAGDTLFALGRAGVWASDGRPAGTRKVKDLGLSPNRPSAGVLRGEVYFSATDDPDFPDYELWKSDGTAEGTVLVNDIGSDAKWGDPAEFVALGSWLYFSAEDVDTGRELWRTDGTTAGTHQVVDLAQFASSDPYGLNAVGDRLLFFAADGDGRPGLWATDGTAAGTVRLAGVAAPRVAFEIGPVIAAVPGALLFLVQVVGSGSPPYELWRSDGTPAGTARIQHLLPAGTRAAGIWPAGERIVLAALSGSDTRELWVTDGTLRGTRRIADFGPPLLNQPVAEVAVLGPLALFRAAAPAFGEELWAADLGADLPPPPLPVPPAAPSELVATGASSYSARLTWRDNSPDETSFVVERSSPYVGFQDLATLPAGSVSFDAPGLGPGIPYTFRVRAVGAGGASPPSNEASVTPLAVPGPCSASAERLCLLGGRFALEVWWRDQHNGGTGRGTAVPLPGLDRTGAFWFFNPANVELLVKNLDGSTVNGFLWTFFGALSDVEYWLTVTDTEEGRNRTYHNPPGNFCGVGDTMSFPETPDSLLAASWVAEAAPAAGGVPSGRVRPVSAARALLPLPIRSQETAEVPAPSLSPLTAPACAPDERTLCLLGGRYRVEVEWHDQHNGGSGVGRVVPASDLSGYFWFFRPDNLELVVKVLDGTTVNGHVWVFYGALSDVEYTIRVTDTETGFEKSYTNPPGEICGRADTTAF